MSESYLSLEKTCAALAQVRPDQPLTPHAVFWPGEDCRADNGAVLDGYIIARLTPEQVVDIAILRALVVRTSAVAFAVIRPIEGGCEVLLEAREGATKFVQRYARSVDRTVPLDCQVSRGQDHFGILWRRVRGES